MLEEIVAFSQLPGVNGVCFLRGSELSAQRFPATYGAATLQELCAAVGACFDAYRRSERRPTEIYLEYEDGRLLLMNEVVSVPGGAEGATRRSANPGLIFLLGPNAVLNTIIPSARVFLRRQSKVESELWNEFQQEMMLLLSKTMNRAQCEKLFVRVLEREGINVVTGASRDRYLSLGQAVIREVPNRGRHEPLLNELATLVASLLQK